MNWIKPLLLTVLGVLTTSCADVERPNYFDQPIQASAAIAVGDSYAFLSPTWDELWLLTPDENGVSTNIVGLLNDPISIQAMPHGEVLVVTQNEPGALIIRPDQPSDQKFYSFPNHYDRINISEDGRYLIASFQDENGTGFSNLVNPRSITVVDREASAESESYTFSLRGAAPQSFHFTDPVTLRTPDEIRNYTLVFASNTISLVDLNATNESDRQRMISLTEPGNGRTLMVKQAMFSDDDPNDPNDLKLFVLASGSNELYIIDIVPGQEQDIQPSINQVTTGAAVEMYSFHTGTGNARHQELLITGMSRSISVVNAETGNAEQIRLDRTMTQAVLWDQVSADGSNINPRAVLYNPGESMVYFAELDELRQQGTGALRIQQFEDEVESIELLEGSGADPRAIIRYSNGRGVGVLSLNDRFEYPLNAERSLGQFVIGGDRLYIAVPGADIINIVDLRTTSTMQLPLSASANRLVLGSNSILVNHGSTGGWMTIINTDDLNANEQTELRGFFTEGLLDREDD